MPGTLDTQFVLNVPRKNYVIFQLVGSNASRRYNFMQGWLGSSLDRYFPILPTYPWLERMAPKPSAAQYVLKAFAQVPGTSTATQSSIDALSVSPDEWLLKIKGDENIEIQVSVLVTPDPQNSLVTRTAGRLVYPRKRRSSPPSRKK